MKPAIRISMLIALIVSSISANAGVVTFNSDNNHYYQLISFDELGERLDWGQAFSYSRSLMHQGRQGHLATITSAQEDDFVWQLGAQGHFLGASDNSYQNNQGDWEHQSWVWVTGEEFTYTNWLPGEPNHWQDGYDATPNNEDYLLYWWNEGAQGGRWNDTNIDSSYIDGHGLDYTAAGFVVEYSLETAPSAVPVPAAFWLFASAIIALIPRRVLKK